MQSSNEFVIVTQVVHTKCYITLTVVEMAGYCTPRRTNIHSWKMKAPYSVGLLASLALLSNVAAGVFTTFGQCVGFMEEFSRLSIGHRVGYARLVQSPRVLGDSKFKVWFAARNIAFAGKGFELGKRAYLLSNQPIAHVEGNFDLKDGSAEIGQLVQEACYVPSVS